MIGSLILILALSVEGAKPNEGPRQAFPTPEASTLLVHVDSFAWVARALEGSDLQRLMEDPSIRHFIRVARHRLSDKWAEFVRALEAWQALDLPHGPVELAALATVLDIIESPNVHAGRIAILDPTAGTSDLFGAGWVLPPVCVMLRLGEGGGDSLTKSVRKVGQRLYQWRRGDVQLVERESDEGIFLRFQDPLDKTPLVDFWNRGDVCVLTFGYQGPLESLPELFTDEASGTLEKEKDGACEGVPIAFLSLDADRMGMRLRDWIPSDSFILDGVWRLLGAAEVDRLRYGLGREGDELVERITAWPWSAEKRTASRTANILPEGGLLSLELMTTPRTLRASLASVLPGRREVFEWLESLSEAWEGHVRVVLTRPQGAKLTPSIALGVKLRDVSSVRGTIASLKELDRGVLIEDHERDGIQFTTVRLRHGRSEIVPTFAVVDEHLWIAEVPRPLLGILRSSEEPRRLESREDSLAGWFEFDTAALFGFFYDEYLPVMKDEVETAPTRAAIFDLNLLPTGTSLMRHLRRGRGEIRVEGERGFIEQRSSVGGFANAVLLPLTSVVLADLLGSVLDLLSADLEARTVRQRLEVLKGALSTYRMTFGGGKRYPRSLSELLERGFVEDPRALMVPSDRRPTFVEYEDHAGEIRSVAISYRYVARKGLTLDGDEVLMYEAQAGQHGGRFVLFASGRIGHFEESEFQERIGQ